MKFFVRLLFFTSISLNYGQTNKINIVAKLDDINNTIHISQEIIFYNRTNEILKEIYFHNWNNSYKNKNTPLSTRLIEDFNKSLYFSKKKNRGYTTIKYIKNNLNSINLKFDILYFDIIKTTLDHELKPGDSVSILIDYINKIPNHKFTKYGVNRNNYSLKYWYIQPVVFDNKWEIMNNLNMDDMFCYLTDFNINFSTPMDYKLTSNLTVNVEKPLTNKIILYKLNGNKQTDIEIYLTKDKNVFHTNNNTIKLSTNFTSDKLKAKTITSIHKRQLSFLEANLGKYPYKNIFIDKIIYKKNPVYGLNQLPKIFNPFNDIFKYDIQFFKALSNRYINNSLFINKRKKYWINDGIQTFLMIKYIEKYYPEKKILGTISQLWGIRSYQVAKLNFNDKYAFVNQFAMRKHIDQSLNMKSDSLSTFNRKIVNKYKAGLGLIYLEDYIGDNIIKNSIKTYFRLNKYSIKTKTSFKTIIQKQTSKDLDWFFNEYIINNKKIDYTIKNIKKEKNTIVLGIKNKSNYAPPIAIYGIKNKEIKYKKWIKGITSFEKIKIPKGNFDKISLNFEAKVPELNYNNNWKNIKPSILNRPIQFRFLKDAENPYYNQIFYNIEYNYNYYDGVILGLKLGNKSLIKKRWNYTIKPTFGLKSKELKGTVNTIYTYYPNDSKSINKYRSGIVYSSYNYDNLLAYQRLSPFAQIEFKRKNLRSVDKKTLSARYLVINKEINPNSTPSESDNYSIFNINYNYSNPEIINNINYNLDFQISKPFSKFSFEIQYRKLKTNNSQIDFRIFAGTFIHNNTISNFFNYSLNRSSDYLFDYNYFGRSEDTGFLSQQIIIAEGGFKSFFKNNTANKWMITSNNSYGFWRWAEIYTDLGIYKNQGAEIQFKYDTGLRLNFVQNFFEIYLPVQSSNGLELKQPKYHEKIRFVLTLSIGKIYNFIKRGFY